MPDATRRRVPARKRRPRGSINAGLIIDGAFDVARDTSIAELSMPGLAEHLGVAVTSIYWYFRKKEELLNAMTDVAIGKQHRNAPEITAGQSWQDTLRRHFTALRTLHRDDEVLSDLVLRTSAHGREATQQTVEQIEGLVAKLAEAGFTPDNALSAVSAMSVYTLGVIVQERIHQHSGSPMLDRSRQRRMADWSATPLLDGLIDRHTLAGVSDEDFEFGISRLISGFEVLLAGQQAEPPARKQSARRARSAAGSREGLRAENRSPGHPRP